MPREEYQGLEERDTRLFSKKRKMLRDTGQMLQVSLIHTSKLLRILACLCIDAITSEII